MLDLVSQGAPLKVFLVAPACPVDKVTLWERLLFLMSGSDTDEGVAKKQSFAQIGNQTRNSGSEA